MPLTNLVNRTYFFKLYAYRGMFQRRVGGDLDGQCVGLDFGNLVRLASPLIRCSIYLIHAFTSERFIL